MNAQGDLQKRFTWGLDVSDTRGATGSIGGLLLIENMSSGLSYFPGYDGRGNLSLLVNSISGSPSAVFEYSPYGKTVRASGPAVKVTPFRYQSKWWLDYGPMNGSHWEIDHYDYGFRIYSAQMGRFISRDPIGEAGGMNLYAAFGNDPVNRFDILGLNDSDGQSDSDWFYEWIAEVEQMRREEQAEVYRQTVERMAETTGSYPVSAPLGRHHRGLWGINGRVEFFRGGDARSITEGFNVTFSRMPDDGMFMGTSRYRKSYIQERIGINRLWNSWREPMFTGEMAAQGGKSTGIALIYAELSQGLYKKDFTGTRGYTMVPGSLVDDRETGLRTAIFSNSDGSDNVQVFAGTSPWSLANWWANLTQAFGFRSGQYELGIENARENYRQYEGNLRFAGHSLGGGIASAAAIITGGSAYTFNAAGVHDNTLRGFDRSNGSVTSYYSTFDILRIGNALTPASVPGNRVSLGVAGFHGIDGVVKALGGP